MNIQALMQETPHIFYLLDSDDAGDCTYRKLAKEFAFPRIELDADMCKCTYGNRVKTGVEHASLSYLFRALQPMLVMLYSTTQQEHTMWDLGKTKDAPLFGLSQMLYSK